jgi:hypothetical protein
MLVKKIKPRREVEKLGERILDHRILWRGGDMVKEPHDQ